MSTPFTIAKQLQLAVVTHLSGLADLAGIKVFGVERADLSSQIQEALDALGLCIYVFPALPVSVNPNLPGPYCERIEVRVRVLEQQEITVSDLDAYQVAEIVLTQLHEQGLGTYAGLAGANPLQCQENPITDASDDDTVIFDLTFHTSVGLPASAT